jgi:hypothetical protein
MFSCLLHIGKQQGPFHHMLISSSDECYYILHLTNYYIFKQVADVELLLKSVSANSTCTSIELFKINATCTLSYDGARKEKRSHLTLSY